MVLEYKRKSSTNSAICGLVFIGMLLVKMIKRVGERQDPWGTLAEIGRLDDNLSSILTQRIFDGESIL